MIIPVPREIVRRMQRVGEATVIPVHIIPDEDCGGVQELEEIPRIGRVVFVVQECKVYVTHVEVSGSFHSQYIVIHFGNRSGDLYQKVEVGVRAQGEVVQIGNAG